MAMQSFVMSIQFNKIKKPDKKQQTVLAMDTILLVPKKILLIF